MAKQFFPDLIDDLKRMHAKSGKTDRELGEALGFSHFKVQTILKEKNKRQTIELEVAMNWLAVYGVNPMEYLLRQLNVSEQVGMMRLQEDDGRLLRAVARAIKHAEQRKAIEVWLDLFDASWRDDRPVSVKRESLDAQRASRASARKKAASKGSASS